MREQTEFQKKSTTQIVIQPTTFCNINCTYCYLPNRSSRNVLDSRTLGIFFEKLIQKNWLEEQVEIRWHAGEPLALPIDQFEHYLNVIQTVIGNRQVRYSVQTNGLPLTVEWCRLLKKYRFTTGVSIDGPQFIHDRYRLNRKGVGTFEKVMQKIELLRAENVEFNVICVLTDYSLDYPHELYEFFARLSPTSIGFNTEETEGANISKSYSREDYLKRYQMFMDVIYERSRKDLIKIREFDEIENAILLSKEVRQNVMVEPFRIITLDWNGNISTFSPELISYPNFIFGNICDHSLDEIIMNPALNHTAAEIQVGIENCKKICDYFDVCGGGSPSNKYWENKSLQSTNTSYCTTRFKIITDLVLANLERKGN